MNTKFESNNVELIEISFGYLSKENSKDGGSDCVTGLQNQNKNNNLTEYLL